MRESDDLDLRSMKLGRACIMNDDRWVMVMGRLRAPGSTGSAFGCETQAIGEDQRI